MNEGHLPVIPDESIASAVTSAMTGEQVLSAVRMGTGEQNYAFSVKTATAEYVLRMTDAQHKNRFEGAIYWQNKLIPLGVPLAKFIHTDLEGNYSSFPSVLMHRLLGDDLINVYVKLTDIQKKNLAQEIVKIQEATQVLPEGKGFGFAYSYEDKPEFDSWYDFLMSRVEFSMSIIKKTAAFDVKELSVIFSLAKDMEANLRAVHAKPFMWDTSERNVMIDHGKISGIVDVDEICFGDSLHVLALTYTALDLFVHDTAYTDYWTELLNLDKSAKLRLEFYRLCYIVWFMRKHLLVSPNQQKIMLDVQRLNDMFKKSLQRILSYDLS